MLKLETKHHEVLVSSCQTCLHIRNHTVRSGVGKCSVMSLVVKLERSHIYGANIFSTKRRGNPIKLRLLDAGCCLFDFHC